MMWTNRHARHFFLLLICTFLFACASGGEISDEDRIDPKDIAKAAGCEHDEVAVCIEIDCRPHEYRCAAKDDVLRMFKAREFDY